jgi:hypothetical protein
VTQTTLFPANLPAGQLIYARLWTLAGGVWRSVDSTFGMVAATITSPVDGVTNCNRAQPIQWGAIPNAQAYFLYVGTTVGSTNVVNTGEIAQTSFSAAASLPLNQQVYARLWTKVGGIWRYNDSTFRCSQ